MCDRFSFLIQLNLRSFQRTLASLVLNILIGYLLRCVFILCHGQSLHSTSNSLKERVVSSFLAGISKLKKTYFITPDR